MSRGKEILEDSAIITLLCASAGVVSGAVMWVADRDFDFGLYMAIVSAATVLLLLLILLYKIIF